MSHSWEEGELRESSREASPVLSYQSSALYTCGDNMTYDMGHYGHMWSILI
jgi:hypothetical protein